eukprot:284818255_6
MTLPFIYGRPVQHCGQILNGLPTKIIIITLCLTCYAALREGKPLQRHVTSSDISKIQTGSLGVRAQVKRDWQRMTLQCTLIREVCIAGAKPFPYTVNGKALGQLTQSSQFRHSTCEWQKPRCQGGGAFFSMVFVEHMVDYSNSKAFGGAIIVLVYVLISFRKVYLNSYPNYAPKVSYAICLHSQTPLRHIVFISNLALQHSVNALPAATSCFRRRLFVLALWGHHFVLHMSFKILYRFFRPPPGYSQLPPVNHRMMLPSGLWVPHSAFHESILPYPVANNGGSAWRPSPVFAVRAVPQPEAAGVPLSRDPSVPGPPSESWDAKSQFMLPADNNIRSPEGSRAPGSGAPGLHGGQRRIRIIRSRVCHDDWRNDQMQMEQASSDNFYSSTSLPEAPPVICDDDSSPRRKVRRVSRPAEEEGEVIDDLGAKDCKDTHFLHMKPNISAPRSCQASDLELIESNGGSTNNFPTAAVPSPPSDDHVSMVSDIESEDEQPGGETTISLDAINDFWSPKVQIRRASPGLPSGDLQEVFPNLMLVMKL